MYTFLIRQSIKFINYTQTEKKVDLPMIARNIKMKNVTGSA